ncbi:hypothetical protein MB14_05615 [Roseivirga ehrenbergii]|uniref:Uncharacterized protein n=1 Tax=Roseivirga ehrenbergii (strain DSM 102268 / JCM 13514 / KCTC 12282 / NCIMB 14502 / KMM 6017) TaxID=279360 RepID=A0A150X7P2_ROSEK|nr:hypothetical protein [Roseivirga ehrenbergii]KYG74682.1 hypothetical protein MB14_05615 [Roseivirga ehrenbergii]
MTSLEKKTKKIIQEHSDNSSEIITDLKVWFKNFDVFKKKQKLDLDPYDTLYSFNSCDLILNDKNIVLIGKTKFLGKEKSLTPTIFEFDKDGNEFKPRHVLIENIKDVGNDIEIEFADIKYKDKMTLVIKQVEEEFKEKIEKRATTLYKRNLGSAAKIEHFCS